MIYECINLSLCLLPHMLWPVCGGGGFAMRSLYYNILAQYTLSIYARHIHVLMALLRARIKLRSSPLYDLVVFLEKALHMSRLDSVIDFMLAPTPIDISIYLMPAKLCKHCV